MNRPLDLEDARVGEALAAGCDEAGLPAHYRACVRPLLRSPDAPWPRCCGGGCDPCAQTLIAAARATLRNLGLPDRVG